MSRLATGYHNPSPHSHTLTMIMFLLTSLSSLAMAACLASGDTHEPGLPPDSTTGLIVSLCHCNIVIPIPAQQLMILRCIFALQRITEMKL